MIRLRKGETATWAEQALRHYEKQIKEVRLLELSKRTKLDHNAIAVALRKLSKAYIATCTISEFCQKSLIAVAGGRIGMANEVVNSTGEVYRVAARLLMTDVLTTMDRDYNSAKTLDLVRGDEFAAAIHYEHTAKVLLKIAEDKRMAFRVIAHHPALMARMASFHVKQGSNILRTFTVSVDNNLAVSNSQIHMRRHMDAIPASKMSREFMEKKFLLVSDRARLIMENVEEQVCYTDDPLWNSTAFLTVVADQIKERAAAQMRTLVTALQKDLSRYKGFTGFNKTVAPQEAIVVRIGEGVVALSGAPIVSYKAAVNADIPIIKAIAATNMASVEVQQVRFKFAGSQAPVREEAVDWEANRAAIRATLEKPLKQLHEQTLIASKVLQGIKA